MTEVLFWTFCFCVVYAYAGYPLVLGVLASRHWGSFRSVLRSQAELPSVSMVVPVYNELGNIAAKIANTKSLHYPGALEILFISDGSTDGTDAFIAQHADHRITLLALPQRAGKGAALDFGVAHAKHDIVVFSDAAIMLAATALPAIVAPFQNPSIGCVSGEDRIESGVGEGLYGRYELYIRQQESKVYSIVGASGSFYAQRRELCGSFEPGLAPDFLSVLRTLEHGFRAISSSEATGTMSAVSEVGAEYNRKVRTLLRGITTLLRFRHLLNPFKRPVLAFQLISHKLFRWLVPVFLIGMLITSGLLGLGSAFYAMAFGAQVLFYVLAAAAALGAPVVTGSLPGRLALYFTMANAAVLVAWFKYAAGIRQELWSPSRR